MKNDYILHDVKNYHELGMKLIKKNGDILSWIYPYFNFEKYAKENINGEFASDGFHEFIFIPR